MNFFGQEFCGNLIPWGSLNSSLCLTKWLESSANISALNRIRFLPQNTVRTLSLYLKYFSHWFSQYKWKDCLIPSRVSQVIKSRVWQPTSRLSPEISTQAVSAKFIRWKRGKNKPFANKYKSGNGTKNKKGIFLPYPILQNSCKVYCANWYWLVYFGNASWEMASRHPIRLLLFRRLNACFGFHAVAVVKTNINTTTTYP